MNKRKERKFIIQALLLITGVAILIYTYTSKDEKTTDQSSNTSNQSSINIQNDQDLSHLRWTLDLKEDLILIREIVSKIKNRPILTSDVLDLFSKEPELIYINEHLAKSRGTKI